ncbi:MAG: DUF4153 domain-containing protein [Clostridia bacterium]|nr:DUF4153 domain-containing protein [Clostridia bacterium]
MEKLKNLFSNISNSLKETFKKFPITIVIVYFTTLVCAFGTEDFVETFLDDMWFYMMAVWAIGTLFSEKFFKNNYVRAVGEIIALIIAISFRWIINHEVYSNNIMLIKIYITYMIVIPLVTVYKILKDSEVSVKEYAIRVLGNIGKTSAIYILANLGILIVILVFVELILDGNDYEILPRTLILLLGGFYVPAMIDAITNVKTETGKFMRILLTGILMPVALFLIGTLYLYVIKIFLSGELLNKSLFFILSLTFSLAIPGVILLRNYDENKTVLKISNILLYSFIPLMVLQIIAMNVRVGEYGLTESRYMGYLLIIFEIIFIVLMIIKNSKYLDKIILVFAGFVIVGVLTPLNVFDVPVYSQTARITKMLNAVDDFEDLTTKEKNECKKAFVYVKNSYIPEYLYRKVTLENLKAIEDYSIVYTGDDEVEIRDYDYEYLSMYNTNTSINIEEFKKLYEAEDEYRYDENVDVNNYEIKAAEDNIKVTVDIENFIRQMYEAEKTNTKESTFEKIRYLKTSDENVVFYVTNFSVSYENYSNKLDHVSIDGYLLVK